MSILNAITSGAGGVSLSGDTSGNLTIQSAGSNVAIFTTGANVGVATTNPQAKVQIGATGGSVSGANSAGYLAIRKPIDALSTPYGTRMIDFYGYYPGYESVNPSATIISGCDAANSTEYGYLAFGTALGAPPVERARIDEYGNLLVGKTSSSDTVVGIKLPNSGLPTFTASDSTSGASTLNVYSTGASAYRFYVNMAGTVFATNTTISGISDQRLKENIVDLDDGLNAVMALKPRKFDWKEGKGSNTKDVRGFIAQEFETVFPDLIDEWKDPAPEGEEPYKSVRADLIPVLVKAIQELKAEVDELKAKVGA